MIFADRIYTVKPLLRLLRGSSIILPGCEMGHKLEAGYGIREIVRAGYGMKIAWRDRDALISIVK